MTKDKPKMVNPARSEDIVHWGTVGIAGVACGAGARWPGAYLVSNRDRAQVTCLSCQRTAAFKNS